MNSEPAKPSKAERRADLALVVGYREAQLADLLERVREGFKDYDAASWTPSSWTT